MDSFTEVPVLTRGETFTERLLEKNILHKLAQNQPLDPEKQLLSSEERELKKFCTFRPQKFGRKHKFEQV
jgi:hypothetical protein